MGPGLGQEAKWKPSAEVDTDPDRQGPRHLLDFTHTHTPHSFPTFLKSTHFTFLGDTPCFTGAALEELSRKLHTQPAPFTGVLRPQHGPSDSLHRTEF